MAAKEIVVALDVGTTKICTMVAEVVDRGEVNIIGVGHAPSFGLRKGMIVDLESTVDSICESVDKAERMAGVKINSVFAGIAGGHVFSFNRRGAIKLPASSPEITKDDVRLVIDEAKRMDLPPDRGIIHVLPREFIIDGFGGIKNPVGMAGRLLEVDVHMVTGATSSIQNMIKCIRRADLEPLDLILQPIASAEAVLSRAEKELGVVLVDIGGGTTDVAVIIEGDLVHSAVIPLGGSSITNDIAIGLRTSLARAEELKIRHGCALRRLLRGDDIIETINVSEVDSQKIPRELLCEIIESRVNEIFTFVARELEEARLPGLLPGGVVLTGGASLMEGMVEAAMEVLDLPVRLGVPEVMSGPSEVLNNPMYSTAVGLIFHASKDLVNVPRKQGKVTLKSVLERIKAWFKDFF